MPTCAGLPIGLSSITCLDFLLDWDISGSTPKVTITNNSTVANYSPLNWWFYVVSPSGVAIFGLNLAGEATLPTPDVAGVSWTTKVINLPTPFGNAPCGQVEFSPNSPYGVYVYVQDHGVSATNYYEYGKNTTIVRPAGNTSNSCGNFGTALISMKVDCANKNIMCFDSTRLIYNNILEPAVTTNKWTLVYPQDPSGDIPNVVVNNQPNVNFPISINSKGYVLYMQEYAKYDYGNGITVKVQYKLFNKGAQGQDAGQQFAISCNTNLCLLQCQMQRFYELSSKNCGQLERADITSKMVRMQWLFSQVLTGIFQPLCGIDIPKLIDEIKAIGQFDDNCDCNCSGTDGFGFSNPTGTGVVSGSCCPLYKPVWDVDTDANPVQCPNGYFPADVYDPTKESIIGVALSASDVINIINANQSWQQYGTAFDAGNCTVGFFPRTGVTDIPVVYVNPHGGGTGGGDYITDVVDVTGDPPANCPNGFWPAKVYGITSPPAVIGTAYSASDMVNILNSNAQWQVYGTAYVVDNCHVGWKANPGGPGTPPVVVVDPYGGGGGGGGNPVTDVVDVTGDPPPNCPSGFWPAQVYNASATTIIGTAYSAADMVGIMNADASWQVYGMAYVVDNCHVGFFPNPGGPGDPPVVVVDPGGGDPPVVVVVDGGGDPVNCLANYFPAQVYGINSPITVIGVAYNINDIVTILNMDAGWQQYGTAFAVDNCHVGFYPDPGGPGNPPPVVVDPPPVDPGCVGGEQRYSITATDVCSITTPITTANLPANIYVDFGLGAGPEFVGNVTDQAAMIIALNGFASKPVSVTFSAGPTIDQIIIFNSDCATYSTPIIVTANVTSASYLLFGGNHASLTSNVQRPNAERVISMQSLTALGGLPDGSTSRILWHTIKVGNYIVSADTKRGQVLFYDITNPLVPTLARNIQLDSPVGNCFAGTPNSTTYPLSLESPPTSIGSSYSLHMPTDYYASMGPGAIYVVEAVTGCIWKIDFNGVGSGVVASFQNNKLIGKCPRVLLNGKLYFTQDGSLENNTGQSSGVAVGEIVVLDTSDFTGTGLSVKTIFPNFTEYAYAASFDGANTIWFTGSKVSIATYNIATDTVDNVYTNSLGGILYRANSTFYNGKLYIIPQHLGGYQGLILNVASLPTLSFTQFDTPTTGPIDALFNFTPLGNCIGVLTSARVTANGSVPTVGFYYLDGTYLSSIVLDEAQEIFNIIPVGNIVATTPNNYL